MAQLEVHNMTKSFGGVVANDGIDLNVEKGEVVGLIGPNGAGKSTLFNCIAGYYPPDSGTVIFEGQEIQGLLAYEVCNLGIARTFQITRIFPDMTVLDNVIVGALLRTHNVGTARRVARETIEFTGLASKNNEEAASLTIADKKRLELTRALATQPSLIMLDEAMAGLTPVEQEEAIALIRRVNQRGISVLLVEHVMEVVMPISERVVVLDQGVKIAEDVPQNVVKDRRVIEAYLGERYYAGS
jgi:branched-chain amino acid transport system ATP-binding protein